MKQATIIGSGLVGSLWSIYLSNAGYRVKMFERMPDLRNVNLPDRTSINLAVSCRGWKALDTMGIGNDIRGIAVPMFGRTIHAVDGSTTYQPYGKENQAIYSVSRKALNNQLLDIAQQNQNIEILFNEDCTGTDVENGIATFRNTLTGLSSQEQADVVFATDGAFSAVRGNAMQKMERFNYSQQFIDDGYREILLPANNDGTSKLNKNTLHIWPRGKFMLVALPNFDGTFTCTLFMPVNKGKVNFQQLTTVEKTMQFFKTTFPDFYALMPTVTERWVNTKPANLAIVKCEPWFYGKTVLMGDAAHATVPFFGQGMNCGFEDCTVMWDLMQQYQHDWSSILPEYQRIRKPNTDAMQTLSQENYKVMRNKVRKPIYQLQQKIERQISALFPQHYFPLYSMVSFTNIGYSEALKKGTEQEKLVKQLIKKHGLTDSSSQDEIDLVIMDYESIKFQLADQNQYFV